MDKTAQKEDVRPTVNIGCVAQIGRPLVGVPTPPRKQSDHSSLVGGFPVTDPMRLQFGSTVVGSNGIRSIGRMCRIWQKGIGMDLWDSQITKCHHSTLEMAP